MSEPEHPQDPFAAYESDKTIIKPVGGAGRRAAAEPVGASVAPAAVPAVASSAVAGDGVLPKLPGQASLNPLVQAAAPLLAAAPRLRVMARHPNPQALRASLVEAIQRFEALARAEALPNEQIVAARYVLCTLLDESASSTPWGGSGAWSSQSLLVQFHNEGWGGEKVFQLLSRLAETPAQHRNLLELIYVALSLGFEGRYRVVDKGLEQLAGVRERLGLILRQLAPPVDTSLSPQWQGLQTTPPRLRDGISPWMVAVAALVLLTLVYLALNFSLNARSDVTFAALQGLDVKAAAPPPPVAMPPAAPRLAQLLKSDIDAGLLQVSDLADRSVVTLHGDSLFDAGSASISERDAPLFDRIAQALNQVPGRVLISGYTDNVPIRSLRFPSNWHLSKARAETVRDMLARHVVPARLSAEGQAESDPIADNSTPAGRARNRRVEITLFVTAPN